MNHIKLWFAALFVYMTNYLTQYREAIRRGEIRAGYDMIDELDRLIAAAPSMGFMDHPPMR